MQAGSNPNASASNDVLILLLAARINNQEAVNLLVSAGADPNAEDEEGIPIILRAALEDNQETMDILVKAGANPNAKLESGIPILFWAIEQKSTKAVKLLIDVGASTSLRYNDQTLMQYAQEHKVSSEIITILEKEIKSELSKYYIQANTNITKKGNLSHTGVINKPKPLAEVIVNSHRKRTKHLEKLLKSQKSTNLNSGLDK